MQDNALHEAEYLQSELFVSCNGSCFIYLEIYLESQEANTGIGYQTNMGYTVSKIISLTLTYKNLSQTLFYQSRQIISLMRFFLTSTYDMYVGLQM